MKLRPFPPCEIEPDWVLSRYYGWHVAERRSDAVLFQRRVGPVVRRLLLVHGAPQGWLDELADEHALFSPTSTLTVQDFAREDCDGAQTIGGRALARGDGRWFGAGTFFYDLGETEAQLRARFPKGKLNHAKKLGLDVIVDERPSGDAIDEMLGLYAAMAKQKGLPPLDPRQLGAMARASHMLLVRGRIGGATVAALVVYVLPRHGYFLHAARAETAPRGVADVLHWEAIRWLRDTGRRWYDMGLVPSVDPSDGLYVFKQRLGGDFCSSGVESVYAPRWVGAVWAPLRDARDRVKRRLAGG